MKRIGIRKGLLAGGLVAMAVPLLAVSDDGLPGLGGLDDDSLFLENMPSVFSASKYEQRLSEAPASVSIVTAEEISRYGYRTLEDVLDSIRGFHTTNDRNYSYSGLRGFNQPGDYGTRLLLLIDGKRANDGLYDATNIARDSLIDIDLIDRVEVIRGAGSSLYGSNAVLGVINIITKRGRDLKGVEMSANVGSNSTLKGRVSYGDKLDTGLEVLVSATGFGTDGNDHLYYPEFDDPASNNGIAEDLDEEESKNLLVKLAYGDFSFAAAYNDRTKNYPTASYGTYFNDPRAETYDEKFQLFLNYQHSFANDVEISADLNYGYYDYHGIYVYDYSLTNVPDPTIWDDTSQADWWRYELQASIYSFDNHKLIAGAEYRDNSKMEQRAYDPYDIYLDDNHSSDIWGVYLQDEYRINDKFTLSAGIRHDDYDYFGGTTNPRGALIYSPQAKTTFKLIYGQAFRAPNGYELYYNDGSYTTKSPVSLEPEEMKSIEVVWEQGIGSHVTFMANVFNYKIDNLISLQTDPADGLLVFTNVDEVETNGIGMELEGKWPDGWAGRVSYSFQDAENKMTGADLPNSPRNLLKANLIAPVYEQKLFAGIEYQYVDKRDTLGPREAADYSLVNLTLSAPDVTKGLSVSGSIYNLFDEEYGDVGSEEHTQLEIPQDGRTFRLKATYNF